ncbi:hypothetical protein IFM51744_10509 [Aspergillus udagawae]|nr:hypothetical protein IFM51744_10509 [Aspergillus udagawae]
MLPWATAPNRNLTIAVATLYINFSVYFTSSGKILIPDSSEQGLVLISRLIKLITSKEDLEEVYRAVVALGTLIKVLDEAVKSATREVNDIEYILEKILTTKKGNDCISEEAPSCTDSNTRLENGQYVTTTTPSCRPTFQWDGQNCVSEGHPDCESPGTWDGQACVLPGQLTCPGPNTVPVPVNGSCIAQFHPLCQPPTVESNGVCLVERKVNCKEGVFNGQDCVVSDKPRCPPLTTPSGDKCVGISTPHCQTGYKWVGGQCVSIDVDPCSDGFREENGQCVSDSKPDCTGTSYLDGDHCIGGKPTCTDGAFDNGDCVSDEVPQCTPPKPFKNGQCVELHTPTCYPPFVFNPAKNTCVDAQGPRCPQGQVYHDGKCVLVPDQDFLEYEWCPALPVIAQSLKFGA